MKGNQTVMIAIGNDHLINADLVKTATMERRGPTAGTVVLTMHDGTEHRIAYPPVEVGGIDGRKVIMRCARGRSDPLTSAANRTTSADDGTKPLVAAGNFPGTVRREA